MIYCDNPEKLKPIDVYNALKQYTPNSSVQPHILSFFIETIIEYSQKGLFGFELGQVLKCLANNVYLFHVAYQIDLDSLSSPDPLSNQIIAYFKSFI